MIKLKRTLGMLTTVQETLYVCTFCGHKYSFFHISPIACETCSKVFPDMMKLAEDSDYRVKYHFKRGE